MLAYVSSVINLTQTTSASYLLMASLDISRRNLALRGAESFSRVVDMAEYARREINEIGGYYAYGSELINGGSIFDFDVTKLAVYTRGIGLTGIEVYDLLRDEYDIQVEFGDLSNMLAYISIGDRIQDIERLVGALADIKRLYAKPETNIFTSEYIFPHGGSHATAGILCGKGMPTHRRDSRAHLQRICDVLPAGHPHLGSWRGPITQEIIDYIEYLQRKKAVRMQGPG